MYKESNTHTEAYLYFSVPYKPRKTANLASRTAAVGNCGVGKRKKNLQKYLTKILTSY